jgi:hypothetical protein
VPGEEIKRLYAGNLLRRAWLAEQALAHPKDAPPPDHQVISGRWSLRKLLHHTREKFVVLVFSVHPEKL